MNYDTEIQIHKNAIGSKTKLQESLLEAVQILHDGFIVDEKIPKTLECRIADDSKKDKGIYIVDYMNNKFEVSCFLDETFNVNDIVCVLVPDGDFAKTKIIIGSSDGSGEGANWVTQEQLDQAVTTLQTNFQAGVDAIGAACTRKGSPPASHSLEDTVAAIDAIQTGGNYMTKEIREDGTYYASDDNVDAYDIVIVNKDVGQPHTVVFYDIDGTTILKTQANVPYHGYASCTALDGTIVNGQYFKGWNPSASDIIRDTFCYPVFGDYIIQPGEIEDDWETICEKRGADYPLGSYKPLVITVPPYNFDYDFNVWNGSGYVNKHTVQLSADAINIALHMYKVAEGEDNSVSTWISNGNIYVGGNMLDTGWYNNSAFCIRDTDGNMNISDWGNSAIRKYLNTYFLDNLPISLKNTITQVNKSYIGFTNAPHITSVYPTQINKESLDKIWMLSKKELYTKVQNYPNIAYLSGYEVNGIDYSSVYMPTLSNSYNTVWTCLRTSGNYDYEVGCYKIYDYGGNPLNGGSGISESDAFGRMMFGFCL